MALIKCEECGQMVSDQVDVCPSCGAPIERKVKCAECGFELRVTDKACPTCGCPNPLYNGNFEDSYLAGGSMPKVQYVILAGRDYYSNTGKSGKSRFSFFLLALFFWWLGLPYFYVGKKGAGAINVICSFLFFYLVLPPLIILLLSLFAGCKALVMTQKEFEDGFVFTDSSYPL